MGNSNSEGGEDMNIGIKLTGMEPLEKVFNNLADFQTRLDAVRAKQVTEISNRAAAALGTPGATPRDTGELRISAHADYNDFSFGYSKEYAGHVEYGHRTRNGGFVEGQHYLETNVDIQRPIYKEDAEKQLDKVINGG